MQTNLSQNKYRSLAFIGCVSSGFLLTAFGTGCGGRHGRDAPVKATTRVIGEIVTASHITHSDKLVLTAMEDPQVDGITAFVSRTKKGEFMATEETSDAQIAVRQTGPIVIKKGFENEQEILTESRSLWTKEMHVTRFWDAGSKSFLYIVHTDKALDGSPKHAISAVAAQEWEGKKPDLTNAPSP